jgi:hypothetical protein
MTMLERAARVLASSFGDDWDDLSEEIRESLRDDIRAVLQAIREPSFEMLVEFGADPNGTIDHDYARERWQAMIDAALSD